MYLNSEPFLIQERRTDEHNVHVKPLQITDYQFTSVIQDKENFKEELCSTPPMRINCTEEKQNIFSTMIANYDLLIDVKPLCINSEFKNTNIKNEHSAIKVQQTCDECVQFKKNIKNPNEETERVKKKLKAPEQIIREKLFLSNNQNDQNLYKCSRLMNANVNLNSYKRLLNSNCDNFDKQKEKQFNNFKEPQCTQFLNLLQVKLNRFVFGKFKIISENQQLQTQYILIKYTHSKLESILQKYKMQSEILVRQIGRSNYKLQFLRFTLKNNSIGQAILDDTCVSISSEINKIKIRNSETKSKIEFNNERIINTKVKNNQLVDKFRDLCSKIDITTNKSNEKQKLFIGEICKVKIENKNLKSMLNLKRLTIKQLVMELSNVTKMITTEIENVHEFKKLINKLQLDQNIQTFIFNEIPKNIMNDTNVNIVLNKFCSEQS